MRSFIELSYLQRFNTLPSPLYQAVQPQGLNSPVLVCASEAVADILDLDSQSLFQEDSLKLLSGNAVLSNWQPLAMKYTGHQFGYYNPDLGDGRGLLLAEVNGTDGNVWDLHLKGAGLTPYSRQGDGRAVLRSSIREFLCSEAMAALKIPTTRALCVVGSNSPVYREQQETAATLLRVAKTHIRFGHFEYCSFTDQHELLKELCDHVLSTYFKESQDTINPYLFLYTQVVERTASLLAHWQSIGFAHGVMNTDNMSIIGDTFDYGPFAFLDDYIPSFICNHSDHQGRYAFNQQPNIANWNLAVLAQALLPLVNKDQLIAALDSFPALFTQGYQKQMLQKLGLSAHQDNYAIIDQTIAMLSINQLDYTIFFRNLSQFGDPDVVKRTRDECKDIVIFDQWLKAYNHQVTLGKSSSEQRTLEMNKVNPKYILRNYLAQEAIEAAENGDFTVVKKLHKVLAAPYDEQPENERFARRPPQWGKELEISCSS